MSLRFAVELLVANKAPTSLEISGTETTFSLAAGKLLESNCYQEINQRLRELQRFKFLGQKSLTLKVNKPNFKMLS